MSQKNVCDRGNLFQVPINYNLIVNWTPLKCNNKDNPKNCAPTAVVMTSIKTKESAEKFIKENNVEELGTLYPKLLEFIRLSLKREIINENDFQPIENLGDFLREKLFSGNITIINLGRGGDYGGHTVSIARKGDDIILFVVYLPINN
jgi:hypothetical protein